MAIVEGPKTKPPAVDIGKKTVPRMLDETEVQATSKLTEFREALLCITMVLLVVHLSRALLHD
nr:hypothetical protein B0A51_14462 [Rachicladosporium sp. CCFEE 5018]